MQPERKGGDNRPTATARGIYTLNKCFLFNNGLCGFRAFSRLFNTFLLCLRYLYIASSAPFRRVPNAFFTYFRLSFPCLLQPLGGVSVSPDSCLFSQLFGLLQPYCCIQGSSSVLYNLLTLRFRVSSSIFLLLCRRPLLSLPIEFPAVCGSVVVATFQLPTDYCRVILVFLSLYLLAFSPYTYRMS